MSSRITPLRRPLRILVVALLFSGPVRAQQPADAPPAPQQPASDEAPAAQERPAVRSQAEIRANQQAQELLEKIEQRMRSADWVRTRIRQEVELRGQKLSAEGEYIWGKGDMMKLELDVRVSDVTARLLELSDGQQQWHVEEILDVKKVERLSLDECRSILNDPDFDPEQRRAFLDARGLGGLAPFVDCLQEFFIFTQIEEVEEGGKKLLVLRGTWNEEKLGGDTASAREPAQQQNQQQAGGNQNETQRQRFSVLNLPPDMPSAIAVWVDPSIPWIVRVEMVAERAPKNRPGRVILEFTSPEFPERLQRDNFAYTPPDDVRTLDRTGVVIETLKLVLQQTKANRQQATASSSAEPSATTEAGASGGLLGPSGPATPQPRNEPKPAAERDASEGAAPSGP